MSRLLVLILWLCLTNVSAKNVELENNEVNCKKVNGFGADDRFAIAKEYKVALSSVIFLGARWSEARFGSRSCIFLFDTPVGPKRCAPITGLLSNDGGKTAFGAVSQFGNLSCWD